MTESPLKVKDWLGNDLEVGTTVLYAISNDHYAGLVLGKITEIIFLEEEPRGYKFRKFKLKIQPILDSRPGGYSFDRCIEGNWVDGGTYFYTRKEPKPVTIQNVEKVVAFPTSLDFMDRINKEIDEEIIQRTQRSIEYAQKNNN